MTLKLPIKAKDSDGNYQFVAAVPTAESFHHFNFGGTIYGISLVDVDSEHALNVRQVFSGLGLKAWGSEIDDLYDYLLTLHFEQPIFIQYGEDLELELPDRSISDKTGTSFLVRVWEFAEGDDIQAGVNCEWIHLGFYMCTDEECESDFKATRQQYRDGATTCPDCAGGLTYVKTESGDKIRSYPLSECATDLMAVARYALYQGSAGDLNEDFNSDWVDYWGCPNDPEVFVSPEAYTAGQTTCPEDDTPLVEMQMRWVVEILPEKVVFEEETIFIFDGEGAPSSAKTYRCAEFDEGEEIWEYEIPQILDKTTVFPYATAVMETRVKP